MSIRTPSRVLLAAAALSLTFAAQANAQATRTWVSGVGDDVNSCSRTTPCKTWAGAISKTAAGGEINALDSGGFGGVTITKAITIDAGGVIGGVLNTGTSGVIVNAGPADAVVLRGLDIYGANAAAACGYGGLSGVRVLRAGSVRIEDTRIGHQQKAIEIAPSSAASVLVNRVDMADNCAYGVLAAPTSGGTAAVTVRNSTIANSGTALSVADNATAWLTGSTLFANALALEPLGTGVINDFGDNRLAANAVDGSATNDLSSKAPAGPAGPAGATGATGATGQQGPAGEAAVRLLLATTQAKLTARAGRAVSVTFAATAPARTTLTVTRKGKRIARLTGAAEAGSNRVRWNGRAPAGAYTLKLSAVGADGQTATTTVALKLSRR